MNTQKSIYEKLFKNEQATELANQKVELGLAQDMTAYATRISKASGTLGDMEKNIAALRKEYIALSGEAGTRASAIMRLEKATQDAYNFNKKQYAGLAKNATDSMKKFEATAKEMGLKPDTSAEYKKLASAMAGNGFKALENLDNRNYFFDDSAKNQLLSTLARIK
jgi:hypothetical protein